MRILLIYILFSFACYSQSIELNRAVSIDNLGNIIADSNITGKTCYIDSITTNYSGKYSEKIILPAGNKYIINTEKVGSLLIASNNEELWGIVFFTKQVAIITNSGARLTGYLGGGDVYIYKNGSELTLESTAGDEITLGIYINFYTQ